MSRIASTEAISAGRVRHQHGHGGIGGDTEWHEHEEPHTAVPHFHWVVDGLLLEDELWTKGIDYDTWPGEDIKGPPERSRHELLERELTDWWHDQADNEIARTVPKAVEYGATDLLVMAKAMEQLLPAAALEGLSREAVESLTQEMAVAFYALGKVSRLFGAYAEGRPASADTWFDLGVYCRMAERIRETGRWV